MGRPLAHPWAAPPRPPPALPSLTSGHVTGTEEEGGGKEGEAIEGDGREGLSRAQGIQQPDEQTADAEVDGPTVRDHPVVAMHGRCRIRLHTLERDGVMLAMRGSTYGRARGPGACSVPLLGR